eukprot:gnl/TRDRNA2_/TRDRNA2_176169_c6_seq8.p1 gnl/TRDRNA2_/TRDRNA2_176169_c6~~gnl/TRDRNA2_/TRDRNA2_176169_c6_seq8.p1  ORF type:complete len:230 (+),score=46.61 gnl/TRDRNA2_/TRDRNA2_176169_c6_seq8:57-746(+)
MAHFRTPSRFSAFRAALVVCTFTDPVAAIRFATVSFGQEKANAAHLVAEDDLEVSPQADDAAELHETDEQFSSPESMRKAEASPVIIVGKAKKDEADKSAEDPCTEKEEDGSGSASGLKGTIDKIIAFGKNLFGKGKKMLGRSGGGCEPGDCPSDQFGKKVYTKCDCPKTQAARAQAAQVSCYYEVTYCYTECDPIRGVSGDSSQVEEENLSNCEPVSNFRHPGHSEPG